MFETITYPVDGGLIVTGTAMAMVLRFAAALMNGPLHLIWDDHDEVGTVLVNRIRFADATCATVAFTVEAFCDGGYTVGDEFDVTVVADRPMSLEVLY
jgi:hypothetical protein